MYKRKFYGKKKGNKVLIIVLILIFFITLGYSLLGNTLNINGISNFTKHNWSNTYTDCYENNWLWSNSNVRLFSEYIPADKSHSNHVFLIFHSGVINEFSAADGVGVRPTVYLKSSINITSGNGSYENPFTLG